MSYSINLTNGSPLVPGGLSDGTVDTSHSSLTLIGKDYAGYGQFLNENFIYLLENFASQASPSTPLAGQLWWDTTNNILRVWSGSSWKISTGATSSPASQPPGDLSSLGGDLWFDTTNSQLKVYTGTQWVIVGPVAASSLGNSGAIPVVITDTSSATHICIELLISGVPYAIISKDIFTTSQVAGFSSIAAGLNFATVNPPLGLNTQSVLANPNTLVQRDTTGSITANNAVITNLAVSTILASGIISSVAGFQGNITGNVTATNINATTISLSGTQISTNGLSGPILTPSQPLVTSFGVLTGLQVGNQFPGAPAVTNLWGSAYFNGELIATVGNVVSFSSVNGTVIGNVVPASGTFTTVSTGTLAVSATTTFHGAVAPATAANIALNLGQSNAWWNTIYGANYIGTSYYGTTFTGATVNLTNSVNVADGSGAYSQLFSNGDIYASRAGGTTGVIFLGSGARYLYNDGTNYQLPGQGLVVGGAVSCTTLNGTAVHANYSDLAERYASDAAYIPGTVVELGGSSEVTQAVADLSENIFGVVSTNPAYLMNSKAGTDATHPAIALAGRVPVRVIGLVSKGDRLVSAGNGVARVGHRSELTPFNVIGRSLDNKTTIEESLIEAVVKLNG